MIDAAIEVALRSTEPVLRLRYLGVEWLQAGVDRRTVLERFDSARLEVRDLEREKDENALADAMDFLIGWCSPHMTV